MLVPSLPEYESETPGQAEGNAAVHAPPATLLHGAELRLPTDAPDIASADSARPVMSFAASAAPVSQAASSLAPVEPSARDMAAAAASADTPPRAEQATQPRADSPLPADARTGGAGQQPATQDGDAQGQARLQELLARLGASGDASRTPGDTFRSLLQGAEGGTPSNTGALTYAQAVPAGPAREPAGPSLPVHTPLRHPEWSDEVSQRIRWAIGNQVHSAELKINPPQLGPVEVRVSVDADRQMSVTLSSQHALVRETLTDSLPKLRDLMSEHGFGAVSVDVSQHSSPDGRQRTALAETDPAARAAADADADRETEASALPRHSVRGLVDLYA
jgi:flagellar hook-length control protein FliK